MQNQYSATMRFKISDSAPVSVAGTGARIEQPRTRVREGSKRCGRLGRHGLDRPVKPQAGTQVLQNHSTQGSRPHSCLMIPRPSARFANRGSSAPVRARPHARLVRSVSGPREAYPLRPPWIVCARSRARQLMSHCRQFSEVLVRRYSPVPRYRPRSLDQHTNRLPSRHFAVTNRPSEGPRMASSPYLITMIVMRGTAARKQ